MARATTYLSTVLTAIGTSLQSRYAGDTGIDIQILDSWPDVQDKPFAGKQLFLGIGDIIPAGNINGSDSSLPVTVEIVLTIYDDLRVTPNAYLDSLLFVTDLIAWGHQLHVVDGRQMRFVSSEILDMGFESSVHARGMTFTVEVAMPVGIPSIFESTPEEIAAFRSPSLRFGAYTGPWPPTLISTVYEVPGITPDETTEVRPPQP